MSINGALFVDPRPVYWGPNADGDLAPLAGGKLNFYIAGTATPLDVFTDIERTIPHENPVVLDGDGRAPVMYRDATAYKVVLTTADDVEVCSTDNVVDPAMALLEALGTALSDGARDLESGDVIGDDDHTVTIASTGGANPCVVQLPPVADRLWPVVVKQGGTVALAVTPDGADTIDGVPAAYTVPAGVSPVFGALVLLPDPAATNWIIAASHGL